MFESKKIGIVLSYINTILSMVFGIILSSYLIKAIGDTEYGLYQTVTAFANYLLILELGTGTITQRNVVICSQKPIPEYYDTCSNWICKKDILLFYGEFVVVFPDPDIEWICIGGKEVFLCADCEAYKGCYENDNDYWHYCFL